MEIQKVCHSPKPDTVQDIPKRATDDRSIGNCLKLALGSQKQQEQPAADAKCKQSQSPPRETRKHTKGHAIVSKKH